MILELKAAIHGGFFVDNSEITTKKHPYCVKIKESDGVIYISAAKQIIDYHPYITKLKIVNGKRIVEFTDSAIYEDLKNLLKYIEAVGSLNIDITSVALENYTVTWIPESPEEEGIMPVYTYNRVPPVQTKKLLNSSNIQSILIHRNMLSTFQVPFTYYRIGSDFFHKEYYYLAFIHYFMMLEFCFAEGKFKQVDVREKFQNSKVFKKAYHSFVSLVDKKHSPNLNHFQWLKNECLKLSKPFEMKSVVFILVEYRGVLSHASKRSQKYLENDKDLLSITFCIKLLCYLAGSYLQILKFTNERDKEAFLSIEL